MQSAEQLNDDLLVVVLAFLKRQRDDYVRRGFIATLDKLIEDLERVCGGKAYFLDHDCHLDKHGEDGCDHPSHVDEPECEYRCQDGWIETYIPPRAEAGGVRDGSYFKQRCPIHNPEPEQSIEADMDDDS